MKPMWHLSSLVVLASALQAQTPVQTSDPVSASPTAPSAPAPSIDPAAPAAPVDPNPAATSPESAGPAKPAVTDPATAPTTPVAATPVPTPAATPAPAPAKPAPTAAEPKPATAAPAASAAPSSKPTDASGSASKPAASNSESPKSDKPADDKGKGGGDNGGFAFHPGLTFGTTTMNGQTWTRLSFTPEISFGKLGVGFNIELFMDQNQNLSSRGWDFDNARNGTESVLRKIDYVRWDKPGAPFYARLGTLEGISLGYGLVAASYGNKDRYPDYKELGANVQLNDITGLGLDFETVVNNLQDIQTGGPFTAFKAGLRPFKPMGLPIFKDLAVHAGIAYDWNQYAGLRDQDDDGCPDAVDKAPNDLSTCVPRPSDAEIFSKHPAGTKLGIEQVDSTATAIEHTRSDSLKKGYAERKPFSVIWADASLPLINTSFFELGLHSAFAKPETQDTGAANAGWGAIPLGAGARIGPITLTAEYRAFSLPFQPDYFNALYGSERAKDIGGKVVTKEIAVYGKGAQTGMVQGYFAGAGWDAFGFLQFKADYSDLFPSKSEDNEMRSASASVGLGPSATSLVKDKISLAEVYWHKDRIGLDKWSADGYDYHDAFLSRSIYTVYGYRVGSKVAGGLTLILDRQTTYTRDKDGHFQKVNQMRIESQMTF